MSHPPRPRIKGLRTPRRPPRPRIKRLRTARVGHLSHPPSATPPSSSIRRGPCRKSSETSGRGVAQVVGVSEATVSRDLKLEGGPNGPQPAPDSGRKAAQKLAKDAASRARGRVSQFETFGIRLRCRLARAGSRHERVRSQRSETCPSLPLVPTGEGLSFERVVTIPAVAGRGYTGNGADRSRAVATERAHSRAAVRLE